jgi:hypothetical protein
MCRLFQKPDLTDLDFTPVAGRKTVSSSPIRGLLSSGGRATLRVFIRHSETLKSADTMTFFRPSEDTSGCPISASLRILSL